MGFLLLVIQLLSLFSSATFRSYKLPVRNMSPETATPVKETKAQKAERLKQEKNPLECFDEIRQFARQGLASVPDAWIKTYFRWWGVYTQGDGAGAVGGIAGEGRATPYFMLRIRLSNGFFTAP